MPRERNTSVQRPRFFGRQSHRLLREHWTVQQLAEELYSLTRDPISTDETITIFQQPGQPAIRIVTPGGDTTATNPPIVTRDPATGIDTPFPTTTPGTGGGGGGGGGTPTDPPDDPDPPGGNPPTVPPLGPHPPPPGTPYHLFSGSILVQFKQFPPDYRHFDGRITTFQGGACLPYNPPTINAPSTALVIPTIARQLDDFVSRNRIDGYVIIGDYVSPPSLTTCVPGSAQ